MLQWPTHNEATERKALLSNQEIKKYIMSQQQANTVKKTTITDCGVLKFPRSSVDGKWTDAVFKFVRQIVHGALVSQINPVLGKHFLLFQYICMAVVAPPKYGANKRTYLPLFYVTSRLHEQFFVCDNFCHIKVIKPAIYLWHKNWPTFLI